MGGVANRDDVERPVWIESRGRRLFGIAHPPRDGAGEVGVLFLNGGLQNRAGPQRIYVEAARRFSERGLRSLRIDLPGVGDSEGDAPQLHFDCYDPADVTGAVSFLRDELGATRVVLLGLCAGARVAVKAAIGDARVDAVVAWSLPVVSAPPNMPDPPEGPAALSGVAARGLLRHWAPRVLSVRTWRDYLASGQTLGEAARSFRKAVGGAVLDRFRRESAQQADFLGGLDAYVRSGRPALFAYGERDAIPLAEFSERFAGVVAGEHPSCAFFVIPDGDHTFTSVASEQTAIGRTADWLVASAA